MQKQTGLFLTLILQLVLPAIIDENIEAHEKREWLRDYIRTYLQRDVRDLVNLRELEPFVRAQNSRISQS